MMAPLKIGYYVSGSGHAALIFWALFGGLFDAEPLPFEVTEVTAISEAEYQALFAPDEAPDLTSDIVMPEAPVIEDALPDMAATPDAPPELAEPDAAQPAEADARPDVPQPVPETEIGETPPDLQPPSEDVAILLPDLTVRPQPRPAPRVAPEPVAQPEPDVRIDDQLREEITAEPDAETVQEEQEATSPEESTTEIVTEADSVEQAAPTRSVRPQTRPQRTAAQPQPETAPETAPEIAPSESALNSALTEALGAGGTDTTPEPTGPPMTAGEREALRVAVQQCWNVDVGSTAARVTVTVGLELDRDGKVLGDISRISAEGGDARAQDTAFQAARRAVLRCQRDGYDLPVEKYDRWRRIELVFNPEGMRLR